MTRRYAAKRLQRFVRRRKPTLTKRVQRLESGIEKKYDVQYSHTTSPGVPDSVEITNDLGILSVPPAANDFNKQIVEVTPYISQGTGDVNRIGDSVNLTNMKGEFVVSFNLSDGKIETGHIAHCRMLLVWDNDPTSTGVPVGAGAVPSVVNNPLTWDHLLITGGSPNVSSPLYSCDFMNNDLIVRGKRASIIMDTKFDLVAGTGRCTKRFNLNKVWKAQKLKYLNSGTIVINRQLKLCFLSDRPSGECPTMFYAIRSYFTDS